MNFRKLIALVLVISALFSLSAFAVEPPPGETPPEASDADFIAGIPDADEPADALADDLPDPDGEEDLIAPPPEEKFQDIYGHWAEDVLSKAIDDELMSGFPDGTMRPDATITTSQMITILTRVLGASKTRFDNLAVPSNVWYYNEAGLANFLGLIDPSVKNLDVNMTRQDAFALMARAFALTPAASDPTALGGYSDASAIKAENKAPIAALVTGGYIQGFAGSLNVNGSVSRAEFLTVLYRVAKDYLSQENLAAFSADGGIVVKGNLSIVSSVSTAPIWLDCSSETVSVRGLTTDRLTLKSHELKSLSIQAPSQIGRLVIDCGSADIAPGSLSGVTLETVQLQSGGSLTITDSVIQNIEITGDNQTVSISGEHESLVISGSNNTVTISRGAKIGSISVTGSGNKLYTLAEPVSSDAAEFGELYFAGSKNHISLNADFTGKATVDGDINKVLLLSGSSIESVLIPGNSSETQIGGGDIGLLEVSGNYNTVRKESSSSDAVINKLSIKGDNNVFYLDKGNMFEAIAIPGTVNTIVLDADAATAVIDGRKNKLSGGGSIERLTINAYGCVVDDTLTVKYLEDNGKDYDIDRILGLVSYIYKGNYTLDWALENDYEDYEKEIFVNAKGYSSRTEYLIWINLAMQRVNIFKGSQGDWTLEKSCIVASGGPGSGTPVGVYYTTYKLAAGWTTGSYTCKPVVGFKQGSGYAFHSRLYYPNSATLKDPSIGFPVSAGCIRMYDEDINYIYNEIPLNTTVVVY